MKPVEAWHFLRDDRQLRDGSHVVEAGYIYEWEPDRQGDLPLMCKQGLHASRQPLHALAFAPGPVISRVLCREIVAEHNDKLLCTSREVLWVADATKTLRAFARWCALEVINLWDAPHVVREYLETGCESKRAAARAAAWDAARTAAWDAARAAAWDAQNRQLTRMLAVLHRREAPARRREG